MHSDTWDTFTERVFATIKHDMVPNIYTQKTSDHTPQSKHMGPHNKTATRCIQTTQRSRNTWDHATKQHHNALRTQEIPSSSEFSQREHMTRSQTYDMVPNICTHKTSDHTTQSKHMGPHNKTRPQCIQNTRDTFTQRVFATSTHDMVP